MWICVLVNACAAGRKVISHSVISEVKEMHTSLATYINRNKHAYKWWKDLAACMFVLKKSKYVKTLKGFLSSGAERQVVLRFTVLFCMQSLHAMVSLSNLSVPWD